MGRNSMIVVGYAGGSHGRSCLEQGIAEAAVRDTDLLVINAVSDNARSGSSRGHRVVDAEEIAQVQDRLQRSGVRFEIKQQIGADPSEELLRAMDHPDAELLIIGMRRRTQVGKLLLGSTSQFLLIECSKPVLVVKPERAPKVEE
ncbi:nucleotide-binding universal stress UspA family protein [Gordonia humi]|uniref:Nucleotide-binding universal stress UspA family protein n=2 Tax=Gordonia humi TaxID=686429 RepID=A0A840EZW8_9ACTN|nr:nucleotide-binding universal stress UspA family protein [Gordonia humi]